MIEVQLFREDGVAVVFPSGALAAADFEEMAALVDPFIEAHGELKGLMIVADPSPGGTQCRPGACRAGYSA